MLGFEWVSEWIIYWSRSWEFVKVLELAGKLALLTAALSWVVESGARERRQTANADVAPLCERSRGISPGLRFSDPS